MYIACVIVSIWQIVAVVVLGTVCNRCATFLLTVVNVVVVLFLFFIHLYHSHHPKYPRGAVAPSDILLNSNSRILFSCMR